MFLVQAVTVFFCSLTWHYKMILK